MIKGAYQSYEDEYCEYINLGSVDKTRKEFITFNKIYEKISRLNKEEKIQFMNTEGQSMNNIVYFNEDKDRLSKKLMETMKITK